MDKPLVIRIKEAERQIISCVNAVMREQSLPCYLVEPIIEKVYRQTVEAARGEYENAKLNLAEKNAKEDATNECST